MTKESVKVKTSQMVEHGATEIMDRKVTLRGGTET